MKWNRCIFASNHWHIDFNSNQPTGSGGVGRKTRPIKAQHNKMAANTLPATISVLASSILLPLVASSTSLAWNQFLFAFHVLSFLFVVSWCYDIPQLVRIVGAISVFGQLVLNFSKSVIGHPFLLGAFAIIFFFGCTIKGTSQNLNSAKCVFFDWVGIVILSVIAAITDLVYQTQLLFTVLGYAFGANAVGLSALKMGESGWISPTTSKNEQEMWFMHKSHITKSDWSKRMFFLLCLEIGAFSFMYLDRFEHTQNEAQRWQVAFSFGTLSTMLLTFGLIASGGMLTPQELRKITDSE